MPGTTPIVVFARAPEPGKVKTRLGGAVGPQGAAVLARAFLRDTWSALCTVGWARPVVATTASLGEDFAGVEVWDQGGGDLGDRIERMFRRALAQAPTALAIGADTPGLPRALLDEARRALATADAVLGPCDDGGFYLIGLGRCPPGLLAGLSWSRSDTCQRVRERLESRGMTVAVLPRWFDVDRPGDLDRLERLIHLGRIDAPATAAALRTLNRRQRPPDASPRISVVIPTLDEGRRIGRRLAEVGAMPEVAEVIVVDGGSRDDTVAVARSFAGVRVLEAPRGRSTQMNHGAALAGGDVLLFLHADVSLPADAARWICDALADEQVVAGAFRTWTVPDGGKSRLGPLLHFADLRSRYSSLPYGDQALFVRAEIFHAVGGFPEVPILEDLELARRLRRRGRIRTVPASVTVSGRRFEARPLFYAVVMNVFPVLYRLGVSPARLARIYGDPR